MKKSKNENRKTNVVNIRLSDEEMRMLQNCMDRTGMTKTGVIRAGIQLVSEKIEEDI